MGLGLGTLQGFQLVEFISLLSTATKISGLDRSPQAIPNHSETELD